MTRTALADLLLGAGMAFLAGATDVYGVAHLHDLYVSFMSGNTTSLGIALGRADWQRAGLIAQIIALFVAGATGGTVLSMLVGQAHRVAVSLAVMLLLAAPLVLPGLLIPALVVAMGALNAFMNRIDGMTVGLTYVTGALVKLGQGLGQAVCGKAARLDWLWQAPMWLSLLGGAVAATLVRRWFGAGSLWPLPAVAALLTLAAAWRAAMAVAEADPRGEAPKRRPPRCNKKGCR